MNEKSWDKVKQGTLRQAVWQSVRQAIINGDLMPGTQINQAALADKLGVSRGPLREALSQLEEEGLVKNIQYRGTFVADLDIQVIEEVYSVRDVLEQFAVERAVRNATPAQKAELHAIYENMLAADRQQDIRAFYREDLAFHRQLYCMADNAVLLEMWKMLEGHVQRGIFYGTFAYQIYTTSELNEEHKRILEAVENDDPDTAKREIHHHVTEAVTRLKMRWEALQTDSPS